MNWSFLLYVIPTSLLILIAVVFGLIHLYTRFFGRRDDPSDRDPFE